MIVNGIIAIVAVQSIANLLDRVLFPEPAPSAKYYPEAGQSFRSRTEGFTQRVTQRDGEHIWLDTVLDPHAAGPPPHVHPAFAEIFSVSEGTVSVLLNDKVVAVGAGQSLTVPAGEVHKPFNATDERAVMSSPLTPEFGLPARFGVFLTQIYGFMDEAPANGRPPRVLLQMSRFSPEYNIWLGQPPILIQRVVSLILSPWARLLGYRGYYERFMPGVSQSLPASQAQGVASPRAD